MLLFGVGCGERADFGGSDGRRPNVFLVVVDTLRADALLDPAGLVDTPNIDALAAEGIVFPNAFSHAPMTLPSHTALFSSRLPFDTGVLNNGQVVPSDVPMLAEWLEEYGYATRAVISLATLSLAGQDGVRRGFDEFDARLTRLIKADQIEQRLTESLDDYDGEAPLFLFAHYSDPHEPYHDHHHDPREAEILVDGRLVATTSISDPFELVQEIELTAGEHTIELRSDTEFLPRLMRLVRDGERSDATWDGGPYERTKHVVATIETPVERDGRYELRVLVNQALNVEQIQQRYVREVEYVDEYVGRFVADLKRRGLYEDSILVFTSDHGESLGEKNGFVGHVQHLDDALIHVPLIVRVPDGHPHADALRAKRDALVSHISLVPTILDLVGVPPMRGQKGVSLLDELPGVHVAQTHKPEAERDLVCLRDAEYKLVYHAGEDRFEMFDLRADPAELVDVFAEKGSERADWQPKLRSIAALAADRMRTSGDLSPEVQQQLNALGYGGTDGDH